MSTDKHYFENWGRNGMGRKVLQGTEVVEVPESVYWASHDEATTKAFYEDHNPKKCAEMGGACSNIS